MQRFNLGFSSINNHNNNYNKNEYVTMSYNYMIITRDKNKSHPIITKLQQLSNKLRLSKYNNDINYKMKIENKDSQLMECLLKQQCLRGILSYLIFISKEIILLNYYFIFS